ncbi:MAG: endonuclease III [Pyrinomonadaceae bacterium]|nr:endonuclease III [Pyrinomonadaceae bacterium]
MAKKTISQNNLKIRANKIITWLRENYPDAYCALNFTTPLELLVATILSAQCTDERVNIVTADLFRKYKNCADFANATQEEMAQDIKSINFFNNKAKAIRATGEKILTQFNGEVPQTIEELLTLSGVARKTANVVLGNAFGIASGVVVDTHVSRLSQRLGMTKEKTPEKIERDLNELVSKDDWVIFSHWLISHGRKICQARKPKCDVCGLNDICPSAFKVNATEV